MKYSFYPGCTLQTTGVEYSKSLAYVNRAIGLELIDIPDWNCCGATAGHAVSKELGYALPARNLALCEAQGLGYPIVAACAACYSRMRYALYQARQGEAARAQLERLIELPLSGNLEVISILEAYSTEEARQAIRAARRHTLNGLKVACYYGCLFTRPGEVTGAADAENPQAMDELVALTGAEAVSWDFKTECCGAAHHVDLPQQAKPLVRRILQNARAQGAQAIATACPLCMMNLDMREGEVNKDYGEDFDIPIYFFTELLAVALGASPKEAGINTHFFPAKGPIEWALSAKGAVTHG